MADSPKALIDVREHETFQGDQRDVKTALVHARTHAKETPIADRQEAGEVADAIKDLSTIRKAAEDHKLAITAPWRASTASVNGHYKELLSTITVAEEALKRRAVAFKKEEERQLREAQQRERERIEEEAEAKAADAQAAAELANAEPDNPDAQKLAAETHRDAAAAAVVTPPREVTPIRQLRGEVAALGTRTDYRFEVVDAAVIHADYLAVNEKAIKAAIKGERAMAKAQQRDFNLQLIPGVRIYPEEIAVSR